MRILYVSGLSPFPNDNGGRQRTKLIWEALARVGEVDFVLHSAWPVAPAILDELRSSYALRGYLLSPEPAGTIFAPLNYVLPRLAHRGAQQYARRAAYYSERPRAAAAIRSQCLRGGYDLVVSRYFRCASRSGLLACTPLAIDVDDVDWEFFSSTAEAAETGVVHRLIFRYQARVLRQLMSRRLAPVELSWISKPADAAKIAPASTWLLPNAVDASVTPALAPACATGERILFVGALGWPPNQAGLWRFLREVWPGVRAIFPAVRLQVVGSGAPPDFAHALAAVPGVDFVGQVADVAPYYAHSLFSIIPVYSGAGSHIKVPESLYHGITCVASRFGHRGYEDTLRDGESLLVADRPEDFVRACVQLLEHPAQRLALAERGLAIVRQQYTREAFYRGIAASIERLQLPSGGAGVRLRPAGG